MRDLVGVRLTFTRFVPDGAGMSKVGTERWCGRSFSVTFPGSRVEAQNGNLKAAKEGKKFLAPT